MCRRACCVHWPSLGAAPPRSFGRAVGSTRWARRSRRRQRPVVLHCGAPMSRSWLPKFGGRLKPTLLRLLRNLDKHGAPTAASAIALDAFLSLFPLLAIAGYVLGIMHQRRSSVLELLFS